MNTNKKAVPGNFVQKDPLGIADIAPAGIACKKKRIRRIADPRIEPYKTGGSSIVYYRYRRGTDAPIHLGTADYILTAIQESRKNGKR